MENIENQTVWQQTTASQTGAYGQSTVPRDYPQPTKKKNSVWTNLLMVLALVVGCCLITGVLINRHWEQQMDLLSQVMDNKLHVMQEQMEQVVQNTPRPDVPALPENAMTPAEIYAACSEAVVLITSRGTDTVNGSTQVVYHTGSGFFITADGYVVTNYHVIEGGYSLQITTIHGNTYSAKLIGYESSNDIALLKAEVMDMPYVTMGSSSALQVGEQVVAIGNPLGELTSTLTVGYVSAKDRIVTTEGVTSNMIQTDAAINSGNSGGPLFNVYGQVVGITTSKYSGTSSSGASIEGIGFAIPTDDVAGMLDDLLKYGYITGAYLGVMVKDVDSNAQSYGLPSGAYVAEVTPGYAAQRAGVRANDIIVNIGGYDIVSVSDMSRVLRKFKAGDTTTITVYRNGREVNLSITLDAKPQSGNTEGTVPEDAPAEGDFDQWYEFFKKFFGLG